jgi:hemoglobin/transferrin/lactoferrin receptor protein
MKKIIFRFKSGVLWNIFILFLFHSILVAKVKDTIHGSVQNKISGKPLIGVNVTVVNTTLGAMTNTDGRFTIRGIEDRIITIRVSMIGFETVEKILIFESTKLQALYFELKPIVLHINEEIVVTAKRVETKSFDIPNAMTVLGQNQLSKKTPRSTPEALMETAGVWMQKTNHGGGSPFIRGLVGNQVLVLIDGIRLNNATFRYGPNQYLNTIDPWQIERIEVLRGSGSIQYGSDALGGVVNIISKQPIFSNDGVKFSGKLFSRFMDSEMEKSGRVEAGISSPGIAVLGGLSLKNFGDIKAGGNLGIEAPSGYDEMNGDIKAVLRLSSKQLVTFAFQNVNQTDVPRFDQVAQRGYLKYSFDPQIRRLAYAKFQSYSTSNWVRSINLTASWQQSIEQRKKQKQSESVLVKERDNVNVLGLSMELRSTPQKTWNIVSGVDYYTNEVSSWRKDTDLTTNISTSKRGLYPDGATSRSFAIFVDNAIQLKKMLLNFGGRFNSYNVSASDETFANLEINMTALVGSASIMYALTSHHKLIASVSQGFRSPNINDVSSLGGFDYGIEVPSTDLSPEKTINFELGIKSRMHKLSATFTAYRTNLFDLIDRVQSTFNGNEFYENQRVYKKQNVNDAYVQGVESEFEFQVSDHLATFGSVVYTYGQKLDPNEPMRRIPPFHGLAGVRIFSNRGFWSEARLLFATKQNRLAGGDIDDHRIPEGGTPGWSVFNISGGYSLNANFDLNAGLQNLFDEAYRYHGSGVDGYGRSLWIGLNVKF